MAFGQRLMRALLATLAALDRVAVPAQTRTATYESEFDEPLVQRIDGGFVITFIGDENTMWARFVLTDQIAHHMAEQIYDGLSRVDGGIHD